MGLLDPFLKRPFFEKRKTKQNKIKKFNHNSVIPQQFQARNIFPTTAPSFLSKAPMVLKKYLDFSYQIFKIDWFSSQRWVVKLNNSQLSVAHHRACSTKTNIKYQKYQPQKSIENVSFSKKQCNIETTMLWSYDSSKGHSQITINLVNSINSNKCNGSSFFYAYSNLHYFHYSLFTKTLLISSFFQNFAGIF